jgi:hypothetical protein
MDYIDALRKFAKANNLTCACTRSCEHRQHRSLSRTSSTKAAAGDANAKTELRKQISERVTYYVRDRATSYAELDILNEPYHQPKYWTSSAARYRGHLS